MRNPIIRTLIFLILIIILVVLLGSILEATEGSGYSFIVIATAFGPLPFVTILQLIINFLLDWSWVRNHAIMAFISICILLVWCLFVLIVW